MLNTANILYNKNSFWIPETFMEILCQYICQSFESVGVSTFSSNLQNVYADCDDNTSGAMYGMLGISFNLYLTTKTGINSLIDVFTQTKSLILSIGDEISVNQLNEFENAKVADYFKSQWSIPIKTQSLASTLNIMIQLINGTLDSNNYSIYYVGFPSPEAATVI